MTELYGGDPDMQELDALYPDNLGEEDSPEPAAGPVLPPQIENDPNFMKMTPQGQEALRARYGTATASVGTGQKIPSRYPENVPSRYPSKRKALTWDEVVKATPEINELPLRRHEEVRGAFYDQYVAPTGKTREQFDAETGIGMGTRALGAAKGVLGRFQNSAALLARSMDAPQAEEWLTKAAEANLDDATVSSYVGKYGESGLESVLNFTSPTYLWNKLVVEGVPSMGPIIAAGIGGAKVGTMAAPLAGPLAWAMPVLGSMVGIGAEILLEQFGTDFYEQQKLHPERTPMENGQEALKRSGVAAFIGGAMAPLGVIGRGPNPLKAAAAKAASGAALDATEKILAKAALPKAVLSKAEELVVKKAWADAATPVKHAMTQVLVQSALGGGGQVAQNVMRQADYPDLPISEGVASAGLTQGLLAGLPLARYLGRRKRDGVPPPPGTGEVHPDDLAAAQAAANRRPPPPPGAGGAEVDPLTPEGLQILGARVASERAKPPDHYVDPASVADRVNRAVRMQRESMSAPWVEPAPEPGGPAEPPPPPPSGLRTVKLAAPSIELESPEGHRFKPGDFAQFEDPATGQPQRALIREQIGKDRYRAQPISDVEYEALRTGQPLSEQGVAKSGESQDVQASDQIPVSEPPITEGVSSPVHITPAAQPTGALNTRVVEALKHFGHTPEMIAAMTPEQAMRAINQAQRPRKPGEKPFQAKMPPAPKEAAPASTPAAQKPARAPEYSTLTISQEPGQAPTSTLTPAEPLSPADQFAKEMRARPGERKRALATDAAAKKVREEESKFTERVKLAKPALEKYARTLSRNAEDAADLYADTVAKAWEKRAAYKEERGDFVKWASNMMHNVNADRVKAETAVKRGGPGRTKVETAPAVEKEASPPPSSPDRQPETPLKASPHGVPEEVVTAEGQNVKTRFRIADGDALTTSMRPDGSPNPQFPHELGLQNRDAAAGGKSLERIQHYANTLDPEQVANARLSESGAPVVSPHGIVESGNHRAQGILRALRGADETAAARGKAYRDWLMENAGRFGLKKEDAMRYKNPVLVRERAEDLSLADRKKFVEGSNIGSVTRLAAAEQARTDAGRMSFMGAFKPGAGGRIEAESNREFVGKFIREVIPESQRSAMLTDDGAPSPAAYDRIRNAIFHKVFGSMEMTKRLAESSGEEQKNIVNAMRRAAPALAELQEVTRKAKTPEFDIANDVAEAADRFARLKESGRTVEGFLGEQKQDALPGMEEARGATSDTQAAILRMLERDARSATKIAGALEDYAERALAAARGQGDLTMERARTPADILHEVTGLKPEESPAGPAKEARSAASAVAVERPLPAGPPKEPETKAQMRQRLRDEMYRAQAKGVKAEHLPDQPVPERETAGRHTKSKLRPEDAEKGTPTGEPNFESRASVSDLVEKRRDLERKLRLASAEGDGRARTRLLDEIKENNARVLRAQSDAVQGVLADAKRTYRDNAPVIRLVQALESGAAGDYSTAKRIIRVSLQALDPKGVFNHEAFHDARAWLLSKMENKALEAAFAPGTAASRRVIAELNRAGEHEAARQALHSVEERLAHAYSAFVRDRATAKPIIQRVFEKLRNTMGQIAGLFRGHGFRTADDVFEAVASGRASERAPAGGGDAVLESRGRTTRAGPASEAEEKKLAKMRVVRPDKSLNAQAEEFSQADLTKTPEDYTPGVNTTRLNFKTAIANNVVEQITRQFGGFEKERGGREHVQDWIRGATKMLEDGSATPEKLMSRQPRKPFSGPEEAMAYGQIVNDAAELLGKNTIDFQGSGEQLKNAARVQVIQFAQMASIYESATSEHGRILRAMQERGNTPESMRSEAYRKAIVDNIDKAGVDNVIGMIGELERDPASITRFLAEAYKPTWFDKLQEGWINSLFTPFSVSRNLFGNTAFNLIQVPELLGAAAIGKVSKAFGGKQSVHSAEAAAHLHALLTTMPEALQIAKHTWMTEESRGPTPFENRPISIQGRKGWWIRTFGRTLLATDQFFKAIGYRQTVEKLAVRTAINEGLKGRELKARIAELMDKPPEDIRMQAIHESQYLTFTDEAGKVARAVIQLREAAPFPLKFIAPFINTPAKLIHAAAERSPLALALPGFWAEVKKGGAARDMAMSRMFIGSALATSVAMLAASGRVTGSGPSDSKEKALWRESSRYPGGPKWQPDSIDIGGKYYSYAGIEPLSQIFGTVATWMENAERAKAGEADKVAAAIIGSFFKNLVSKTWLQGPADAIQAITDPDRYGQQYVNNILATAVPGVSRHIARQIDPTLRETHTLLDTIRSRVPGLSQGLPAKINIAGEPIAFEGSFGPDWISPVFTQSKPGQKVANELKSIGYTLGSPSGKINGHELTPQQKEQYATLSGQAVWSHLGRTMDQANWDQLNPDAKERRIRLVVEIERERALNQMKRQYPELRRPAKKSITQ